MWLSSCVQEDTSSPDFIGGEDNPFTISFVLSTQDILTRAESDTTWGDEYDKVIGNEFENQIKNLSLIIYNSTTDTVVATITDFNYFAMAGAADDRCAESYLITTEITEQIGVAGNYRFVVVVNADLADNAENTTYELSNINNDGIPMWGAVTKTISANSNVDLGTIHLLRAVAKIEIQLGDEIEDEFSIRRAVVTKYNTQGYVFPSVKKNEVTNNNHDNQTFNVYGESSLDENLIFTVADNKKSSYLYITEWAATDDNAKIALQFENDNTAYEIEFKNYVGGKPNGDPHDIVRNHHYKYTINQVNTGVSLGLTCVVQPWTLVEESWDYTDLPAVADNGHITWLDATPQDNRVYLNASNQYATFSFGLSAPESATWRAEFVNKEGKQNAFRFTKVVNGAEVNNDANNPNYYMTGNVGEMVTLRVRYTDSNITENNEAYLRILVILSDGRIIQVSELLDERKVTGDDGTITTIEGHEYVMVQTQ